MSANKGIDGYYIHSQTLGEGGYGKVKLATHILTKQQVAIKIIDKVKVANDLFRVKTEVKALQMCNKHDNIARLFQVIDCDSYIYIVMELCKGGELFDRLIQKQKLSEKDTRKIIRSLVEVLSYIHKKGISHRDIKPENILFDSDGNIKLIDFGLCAAYEGLDDLSTCCGSPAYVAPELLHQQPYSGPAADVWSTGVLMYTLLCGKLPFSDNNMGVLYKKIKSGIFSMPFSWNRDVKELIKAMMTTDPKQRITIEQILAHPWINADCDKINSKDFADTANDDQLDEEILLKCAALSDCHDLKMLRQKVKHFGYETATYHLIKSDPSKFKSFEYYAKNASIARRRSISCSDFKASVINNNAIKRKESVEREAVVPFKIANTDVKAAVLKRKNVDEDNIKRRPVARNLFRDDTSDPVNKLSDNKVTTPARVPFLQEIRSRPPTGRLLATEPKTPLKLQQKSDESSKKSIFKRFLENATPRKSCTPRRFDLNKLENITLTNFTDVKECRDRIMQLMASKKVNCTTKNFTIRCVLSAMNVIIVAFELELLVCRKTGCIGIGRKRIRGASWDYVMICEELSKLKKSTTVV